MSPTKLPKWFNIIYSSLSDKKQGLDDIASCPTDTSINNAVTDSNADISGDDETGRDEDQEDGDYSNETIQGTQREEVVENIANVLNKTVCKPHEKRGKVRSQTQALSQLAASINRLADVSAKRLKAEKEDRSALLKFPVKQCNVFI